MKYTTYFAQLLRNQGTPNLPVDDMRTFLNIIRLEAKAQVLTKYNVSKQFSGDILRIKVKISQLTNDLEPKELVQRWINGESIRIAQVREEDVPWDENERYLVKKPFTETYKGRGRFQ